MMQNAPSCALTKASDRQPQEFKRKKQKLQICTLAPPSRRGRECSPLLTKLAGILWRILYQIPQWSSMFRINSVNILAALPVLESSHLTSTLPASQLVVIKIVITIPYSLLVTKSTRSISLLVSLLVDFATVSSLKGFIWQSTHIYSLCFPGILEGQFPGENKQNKQNLPGNLNKASSRP